ncbi:hypothetical protein Tco_1291108 [Tanacetum coccineum]
MPRGQYNVDVAATFGVLLTTIGDLDVLIKDIEAGKHEKLLSGITNDKHMAVMDTLSAMCDLIEAENTHLTSACPTGSIPIDTTINADAIPYKVSHVDDSTIVHLVSIQPTANSYVGVAGVSTLDPSKPKEKFKGEGSKPEPRKLKANFRLLFSENLCEGVNFSIPRKVVETGSGFTITTVTIEYKWKPPRCDLCKIFGHVHDHCPKKVSIPTSVVTSNVPTPTVDKTNDVF